MTVVCSGLLRAFAYRSATKRLWQVGVFGNLALVGVVVGSVAVQVAMVRFELALVGAVSLIPVSVLELGKTVVQMRARARARRRAHGGNG